MAAYGFTSNDTEVKSLANNMLKIQVYFNSLNVETVTESPTYEVSSNIELYYVLCN